MRTLSTLCLSAMCRLNNLKTQYEPFQKRYWGQPRWGRGYFCATMGAVTEEQVTRYLEEQDEGMGTIQVWDEPPAPAE